MASPCWNIKEGWHTSTTPERSVAQEARLTGPSGCPRSRAERRTVTAGQEKMMHRASGTAIRDTQARDVMKQTLPSKPGINTVQCYSTLVHYIGLHALDHDEQFLAAAPRQ